MNPQDPRVDLIRQLLINFKKYADKEGQLADAYYISTSEFSLHALKRGIDQVCNSEKFLPTVMELVNACKQHVPRSDYIVVGCFKCNADGYIFEAKSKMPDGSFQVITPHHIPHIDNHYISSIAGRCDCSNGRRFKHLPIIQPIQFIQEIAIKNNTDCPFESQEFAKSMTYKKLGVEPPKISQKMLDLVESIITRKEKESENG